VDAATLPSWLEVVSIVPVAAAGVQSRLTLQVKSTDPITTSPRDGTFYIVAGNLRKQITVMQTDEIEFSLFIIDPVTGDEIDKFVFDPRDGTNPPAARTFLVTWLPSTIPSVEVLATPGATPFVYAAGSDDFSTSPVAGSNGSVDFTVQPTAITNADVGSADPFTYKRTAQLYFTVSLDGRPRTLPLELEQKNYAIVAEGIESSGYLADGETPYSFTVKSNVPWTAELADPSQAERFASMTTSGDANAAGQPFEFVFAERVTTANGLDPQSIDIVFKSPDGLFPDQTVTIVNNAYYLTLAETSYTPTVLTAHNFTINLDTNIPYSLLPAPQIVTNSQSILSNATILDLSPLKLQVSMAAITPGITAATGTVRVTAVTSGGLTITRDLTVNIPASPFRIVNGKQVAKTSVGANAIQVANNQVTCPYGSSMPRSMAEAKWYVENRSAIGGGLHPVVYQGATEKGMTYIGATGIKLDMGDGDIRRWVFSGYAVLSMGDYAGNYVEIDPPVNQGSIPEWYTASRGIYSNIYGADDPNYTVNLYCVVW
jgi:hypothetical protein